MKISRLVLLTMIAGAALFLSQDRSFDAGTWPLPGPQLYVRMPFEVHHSGDYFIEVAMPKASADTIHVVAENLQCDLSYRVDTDAVSEETRQITTLRSTGEFGWANVILYDASTPFHLTRGSHVITIYGGASCVAARERGATVAILKYVREPTETYLLSTSLIVLARLAVFGGLIVLLVLELRSERPLRQTSDGSTDA
jgi:hypothetical protein